MSGNPLLRIMVAIIMIVATMSRTSVAQDEGDYPNKPVRLIAVSGPGGNPDVLARLLADKLSRHFGKPFVVENMPGAGGVIAAKRVAASAPDGYVLMLGDSGGLAINPATNPNVGYDPLRDFTPITALAAVPTVLIVKQDSPTTTLREFFAYAKARPGKVTFGSVGAGSIHHLTMAIFAAQTGIDLIHVPYRAGSGMVQDVMQGELYTGWSGIPNVRELIANGKLRALAVSTKKRSKSLPDMPTAAELGIADFDVATVIGLQTSAGAPTYIVERLQRAVSEAMREPDMEGRLLLLGMDLRENGTADYAQFIRDDLERYRSVIKKFNLQLN